MSVASCCNFNSGSMSSFESTQVWYVLSLYFDWCITSVPDVVWAALISETSAPCENPYQAHCV